MYSVSVFRAALFLGTLCLVASGDSISSIYVSLAPIPVAGTSYAGYTTNAQAAVGGGGGNIGNINTSPTAYNTVSSITSADITFDTDFNNWRGVANPPSPFNNELGTAVYFSTVLSGNGSNNLSLSDITYTESDTDTIIPNYFGFAGSFSSSDYGADKVGVLANGTLITSGPGTQLVNEIILTDVGVGFDATGQYNGTPQEQLTQAIADENTLGSYAINTCFYDTADDLSSCGSINVNTPEPATFTFISLALALAPFALWRFRRSAC